MICPMSEAAVSTQGLPHSKDCALSTMLNYYVGTLVTDKTGKTQRLTLCGTP